MNYLAHSIHSAHFCPANIMSLRPYKSGDVTEMSRYGIIEARKDNAEGLPSHKSCIVDCSHELMEDINACYLPGGCSVSFYQQASGDWLVAFKANHILVSKYMRLKNEDMQALVRAGLDKTI